MLSFYHIAALFATNAAVSKPQQTATYVTKTETNRAFCYLFWMFSYLSAFGWWESGLVCQRRAAILNERERDNFYKIPARPRSADL